MTRRYIVWIGLVSIAAGVVLHTSMQTRQQQDHLAEVTRDITSEQERIKVLTAEWHSLKTPDRLEALAQRHLDGYGSIKPVQMADLTDVPERLPSAAPAAEVNVATTAPAAVAAPARQVASVATPRTRPVAHVAAAEPTAAPAASKQDDVGNLIARNTAPAAEDGIRTIIERQQPGHGVLWASLESQQ